MKNVFKLICVVFVTFILAGCWGEDKGEIGQGNNSELSSSFKKNANLSEQDMTEAYGKIIHRGIPIEELIVQGIDTSESTSALNIIDKSSNPMILTLGCDARTNTWGLIHNFLDNNGRPATQGSAFSIMNYRKGLTDIREADERGIVFSTSDGDENIMEGLRKITKLDPNSTIAFVIDKADSNNEMAGYAWSRLIKVSDIVSALKKVNLSKCASVGGEPEMEYRSVEELRALARQYKS